MLMTRQWHPRSQNVAVSKLTTKGLVRLHKALILAVMSNGKAQKLYAQRLVGTADELSAMLPAYHDT